MIVDDVTRVRARTLAAETDKPVQIAADLRISSPIAFAARSDPNGFCWVNGLKRDPEAPYSGTPAARQLDASCLDSVLGEDACEGDALAGPVIFIAPPGTKLRLERAPGKGPNKNGREFRCVVRYKDNRVERDDKNFVSEPVFAVDATDATAQCNEDFEARCRSLRHAVQCTGRAFAMPVR